jgi:glyoxylase-like metal-dependent hydrolase (beta-lactamase superfamily II)
MRVWHLARSEQIYSSNVFLVLGDWSRIEDVNTLVDAGADPRVVPFIEEAPTGIGKRKIDRVVLTHRHYDHVIMVPELKKRYGASVAGWPPADDLVDEVLTDGQKLRMGDEDFEVIHTPAHTEDSICLYGPRSHALFVGDTPVLVHSVDQGYPSEFADALARLASRPVAAIYFGHGDPLTERCNERLEQSAEFVRASHRMRVGR